jgi:hypothetical protein
VLVDELNRSSKGKAVQSASSFQILRLSRREPPQRVVLKRQRSGVVVLPFSCLSDLTPSAHIRDVPIECPEYMCYYSVSAPSGTADQPVTPRRLFQDISIQLQDGSSSTRAFSASLGKARQGYPRGFMRSFSFIFSVKRDERKLLTNNWDPHLLENVKSGLLAKESSFLKSVDGQVGSMQTTSLSFLSPVSPVSSKEVKEQASSEPQQSGQRDGVDNPSVHAEPPQESNRAQADGVKYGTLRVTRPVSIRRPKLTGKSVEGAAIHALAASRARASSSVFRNSSTSSKKMVASSRLPPSGLSTMRVVPTTSGDSRPHVQSDPCFQQDSGVSHLLRNMSRQSWATESSLVREYEVYRRSIQFLASSGWSPRGDQITFDDDTANFLFSMSHFAWIESYKLGHLPGWVSTSLASSLASVISSFCTDLRSPPYFMSRKRTGTHLETCVLLAGRTRNVQSCKCTAVLLVRAGNLFSDEQSVTIECRILSFHRRSASRTLLTADRSCRPASDLEATSFDKVSSDMHRAIPLDSVVFDCICCHIESLICSEEATVAQYAEALVLLRSLIKTTDVAAQRRLRHKKYRAFEVSISLKSYRDVLVSQYSSSSIFAWLQSNRKERHLIRCGDNGLMFRDEIRVQSTRTLAFLCCEGDIESMTISFLCHAGNQCLEHFMFRQNSNVSISVFDNIAVEAAGRSYKELLCAVSALHCDHLWHLASNIEAAPSMSRESVDELLSLCSIKDMRDHVPSVDGADQFASIFDPGLQFDWAECVNAMLHDSAFAPARSLGIEGLVRKYLFYVRSANAFIVVFVDESNTLKLSFVEKGHESMSLKTATSLVDVIFNFMLWTMWGSCL